MKRSCRFGLRLSVNLVIAVVALGVLFVALEPGAEAYEHQTNWRRSQSPTRSPDPTATPAPSPAPTPSPDPTTKPTPTPAPSSTPTPTLKASPSPSPTSLPSATPTSIVLTSTLILTSANNGQTFNHYSISTTSGPCVEMTDVSNLTIQNFQVGPCGTNNSVNDSTGIEIIGGSGDNIDDSYIHVENLSSDGADDHDGIFIDGANDITVQGNVLAFNETNVEITDSASSGDVINGNFMLNPRGPFPRGQQFQSWGSNTNITVENNRELSCQSSSTACAHSGDVLCLACSASTLAGDSFPYYADQEDANNFGYTNTYTVSGNWIEGGDSPSGNAIEVDAGSNNGTITNNVLKDIGQGCIAPQQGAGTISGNKCESLTDIDSNQIGMYFYDLYPSIESCGTWAVSNNTIALIAGTASVCNPRTTGCYFNSGDYSDGVCTFANGSGNIVDNYFSPSPSPIGGGPAFVALDPIATTNPPPLIPPRPKNCVVKSPYSTQTSLPPCS